MTTKKPPKPPTTVRDELASAVGPMDWTTSRAPKGHGWNCAVCGLVDIDTPHCPIDGATKP